MKTKQLQFFHVMFCVDPDQNKNFICCQAKTKNKYIVHIPVHIQGNGNKLFFKEITLWIGNSWSASTITHSLLMRHKTHFCSKKN